MGSIICSTNIKEFYTTMKTNEIYTDASTNMKLKNTKFLKHKSRGGILTVEIYIYIYIMLSYLYKK